MSVSLNKCMVTNEAGDVCPGGCNCVTEDVRTWDNCSHEQNMPCAPCFDRFMTEYQESFRADLESEWRSEVAAAAEMDM